MNPGQETQLDLQIGRQIAYFTSSEDMSQVESGSVDLVVTSPPYWNLKDYGDLNQIGTSEDYDCYLQRLNSVWRECFRVTNDNGVLVINVNSRRYKKKFFPLAFDIYSTISDWSLWDVYIWYIPNALPQPNHYIERLLDNKFEYVLVFTKNEHYKFNKPRVPQKYITADPRSNKKNPKGRCLGNVVRIPAYRPPNVKKMNYHVAAFPEELVALLIELYTEEHDRVLDPFLGSGTTLKVAQVMNRRGIGFEINQDFRPLIEERIREPWEKPNWKDIDIIHSVTDVPGMFKPRKSQYHKQVEQTRLL